MPIFIPLICLIAMGLALFRRSVPLSPADPQARDDVPTRLLRWAAGLLSAERAEWGQAMLGELDHIDGWGRRWRFAAGCAVAALLLPPWGRATAAVWATAAVAAASAGAYASVALRYGLGESSWVFAAVVLVLLTGCTVAAGVMVRRPSVAIPGLLGGVIVALAWLVPYGFTFYGFIVSVPPLWAVLTQAFAAPVLVGVAGTFWGGSAAAGRRIARLAAFSAGLGLFLYGTLAVAVIGAAGDQIHGTWTVSASVDDRLGNNAIFYLWFAPLVTAALGWAAAAATARIRPRLAVSAAAVPGQLAAQQFAAEAAVVHLEPLAVFVPVPDAGPQQEGLARPHLASAGQGVLDGGAGDGDGALRISSPAAARGPRAQGQRCASSISRSAAVVTFTPSFTFVLPAARRFDHPRGHGPLRLGFRSRCTSRQGRNAPTRLGSCLFLGTERVSFHAPQPFTLGLRGNRPCLRASRWEGLDG